MFLLETRLKPEACDTVDDLMGFQAGLWSQNARAGHFARSWSLNKKSDGIGAMAISVVAPGLFLDTNGFAK